MSAPLLVVENLKVTFPSPSGPVDVVKGLYFELGRERLGIVGESGSGKSMTGRSILGLVRAPGKVSATRLEFDGIDLLKQGEKGFHRRVVTGSADAAHRSDQAVALKSAGETPAAKLTGFNRSLQHRLLGATVTAR